MYQGVEVSCIKVLCIEMLLVKLSCIRILRCGLQEDPAVMC